MHSPSRPIGHRTIAHRLVPRRALAGLTLAGLALAGLALAGLALAGAAGLAIPAAQAQDQTQAVTLTLTDTGWEPAELQVPANQKFELRVVNASRRSAEFESKDIRREKVITAGQSAVINVGPLKPGSYEFFDDFNQKARGRIIAR